MNSVQMKARAMKLRRGLAKLQDARSGEGVRAAECAVRFILAFILSRTRLFGSYAPFGAAFVASSGAGIPGVSALIGASLGYLLEGGLLWSLKYLAISLLTAAASFVFRDTEFFRKKYFPLASGLVMAACTGIVYAADGGWSFSAVSMYIMETAVVGGFAYLYRSALSPVSGYDTGTQATAGIILLVMTALTAAVNIKLFDMVSVGRSLALIIVMITAYRSGSGYGCGAGVAAGFLMDAAGTNTPYLCGAYGIAAAVSGFFSKRSKLAFTLSFVIAHGAFVMLTRDSMTEAGTLYETFIASVVFLMLPQTAVSRLCLFLPAAAGDKSRKLLSDYAGARAKRISEAFRSLYRAVTEADSLPGNINDNAYIFDRAADSLCRDCKKAKHCWQYNYQSTADAMNNAAPKMLERGSAKIEDFPEYFINRCLTPEKYVEAVNGELRSLLYRRQFKARMSENRSAVKSQLWAISELMGGVSGELTGDMTPEIGLERRLNRYFRSRGSNASAAVFRDRNGRIRGEIRGMDAHTMKMDSELLNKLSAAVGTRLCGAIRQDGSGRLEIMEAEPLCARLGTASSRKSGMDENGDRSLYFKTDEGVLYVILSDGMGSGPEAAKDSKNALNVLADFLKAGAKPETALKILNGAMLLQNSESTVGATVDLFAADLFTGEVKFYKLGAAPSYVHRGKNLRKIPGGGLSAGFDDEPQLEGAKISLGSGGTVLMVSDGVCPDGQDMWLREAAADWDGREPKEFALGIIKTAGEKYGSDDDATVIALAISERE